MKSIFLCLLSVVFLKLNAQTVSGSWGGQLKVEGYSADFIFHIKEVNGVYSSKLDLKEFGKIPIEKTSFKDNTLVLESPSIPLKYSGILLGNRLFGEIQYIDRKGYLNLDLMKTQFRPNSVLETSGNELLAMQHIDKQDYKYRVEDYFAKPKAFAFKISPDGTYLSYIERQENSKCNLYIKNIASGAASLIVEEVLEPIKDYTWANSKTVLYFMDKGGDENYKVYAIDLESMISKNLTPFEHAKVSILSLLKADKDHIIISMNKNNKQVFEPYKVNVTTGEIEKLFDNTDIKNPINSYKFDKDGNLRAYTKLINGVENELYYKNGETFNLLKSTNWKNEFRILDFSYNHSNNDEAYVATNLNSNTVEIILYDLKKNAPIKTVFSNANYDASDMHLSRKRNYEVDYFYYEDEKPVVVPISKLHKKLDAIIKKELPNKVYSIVDHDDNENKLLIHVQSDKLYGAYYQYDANTEKLLLLYNLMPNLKEDDMCEMRPISFKSRDGLKLHGYITLPKSAKNRPVPLIVNPHGGPHKERNSWGFDPEAQLFASRGYATLQLNFRISGGYGKSFLEAGYKEIGRKVMDDLEDGVAHCIKESWVDKNRIAIYGRSHGGYAALMGLVKTPDLYACAVDYVGISSIYTYYASFPEYWKPYKEMMKQIWYDLENPKELAIAQEVSPLYQIEKIKKPLFVIQGANDPRVNIQESDQIVEALRAKGFDVPYMVKHNEGHGFYREENRIEMYKTMIGFFAKYLK